MHFSVLDNVDSSRSRDGHEQWITLLDCASHPKRRCGVYTERAPSLDPKLVTRSSLQQFLSIVTDCYSCLGIEPKSANMCFTESDRDAPTQPTEHVAAATVGLDTLRRPLPKRSLPAMHGADHSVQESAEGIKPDSETASEQQRDAISPTPAGLKSQDPVC
jgi:hypothetical protein